MPLGAKLVAARILLCYCLSLFMLGLVLHPSILDQPHIASLTASPFVIAVQSAGIKYLPSIINGVLIASVFSMANAAVFASSRALVAICERGMGPRFFKARCGGGGSDKGTDAEKGAKRKQKPNDVPWRALGAVFAVAMLAWLAAVRNGTEIFEWLLALASVSNLFTVSFCSCCTILRSTVSFLLPTYLDWSKTNADIWAGQTPTHDSGRASTFAIFASGVLCASRQQRQPPNLALPHRPERSTHMPP